ncbi:MAG: hypothetical protein PHE79_01150 [Eubacteriales bacterium]|nr:hypothetical protein [Eubacteriales bacterium]
MKKILICLLTFILLFSFTGCGAKEKLGEKVAEKAFEEVGGGDLDIDGDKVTIKGNNGETVTFGDSKWPTSELAKNIPEFKDGTVNGVLESTDSIVITLESVKEEDVSSYWETIKKGFSKDVYEMNSSGFSTFSGSNDEGLTVSLAYMDEMLTITVTKTQQ